MNRMEQIGILLTGSLIIGAAGCSSSDKSGSEESSRPNIIFIMADDLGYGDVSCYNPDSKIQTPNMDLMASQGKIFLDAHTPSAVCTPTRYGVLTGRYPWRSELKQGVLWGYSAPLITPERLTIASMLKQADYNTAVVGKWHLGLDWSFTVEDESLKNAKDYVKVGNSVDFNQPFSGGPLDLGFDYFYGMAASWDMPPYVWLENNMATVLPTEITREMGRKGHASPGMKPEHALPELTKKSVELIHQYSNQDSPFFLYFPLPSPHDPIAPNDEFIGTSEAGEYGDFVVETDWVLGQIIQALDEAGISENTLLIFTSDNGPERHMIKRKTEYNHYSSGILKGCKRDNWEGGHRVPFLAKWPGKIEAGSKSHEVISLVDMIATFSDIAKTTIPQKYAEDSYSILSELNGTNNDSPIREATIHASSSGRFAIRKGDWKLMMHLGSGGNKYELTDSSEIQLFNLKDDLSEEYNLHKENPQIVNELKALLEKYIVEGRSTPGPDLQNDTAGKWPQIEWINNK